MHNKINKILQNPLLAIRAFVFHFPLFHILNDHIYIYIIYYLSLKKKLDLNNPKTYNEKLQWLKLHDHNPQYTKLVDKYAVKKHVANTIGKKYIIPTLGVYSSFDDIDFSKLPKQFVIKCTHDSGGIAICKDKTKFNKKEAKRVINKSLRRNYYYGLREWPYKNVKPRIIIEQYMEDSSDGELRDYKFFTTDGKVKMMYIASNRQGDGSTCFDFYDSNFQHLNFTNEGHPNSQKLLKKPTRFSTMKQLSEKIAKSLNLRHARIDFYEANGNIYFGEITFYHMSGLMPFNPPEWDEKLGNLINLPKA